MVKLKGSRRASPVQFLFWNIDGLSRRKFNELKCDFKSFEIILLVETFANSENAFELDGYVCFSSIRKRHILANRNSGGCLIFVKADLAPFISNLKSSSTDIIWLKYERPNQSSIYESEILIIGCVYNSPITSQRVIPYSTYDIMKSEITAFQAQFPNAKFLISGDFNSRTGQLTDTPDTINSLREVPYLNEDELGLFGTDSDVPPRMNCDKHVNTYGKQLIDLCVESELVICNGRSGRDKNLGSFTCYTAFGASVVDYILVTTSFFNHVADFEVLPITTYSIHAQLKFKVMLQDSQKNVVCDQINDFRTNSYQLEPRVRYIIPKEDISEFSQKFKDKFNDSTSATNENLHPNEMLNLLYNTIYETAENYKRTTKPFTKIKKLRYRFYKSTASLF